MFILPELIPHIQDAVSHSFDILRPLLIEFGVVQYFLHDAGAVSRGIWVHTSGNQGELEPEAYYYQK